MSNNSLSFLLTHDESGSRRESIELDQFEDVSLAHDEVEVRSHLTDLRQTWSCPSYAGLPTLNVPSRKTPSSIQIYMISCPHDKWKRDRFEKSMSDNKQHFEFKIWDGILAREKPDLLQWALDHGYTRTPSKPHMRGNIGS